MPETILGFDFGERRVGVAVGQTLTGTATPLTTLTSRGDELLEAVAELLRTWEPAAFVVGIPLTEDGKDQPIARAARRFAGRLADRFRLPVHHADERYSSREADSRFRELRGAGAARRKNVSRQDAVAAQLILEQWLGERAA